MPKYDDIQTLSFHQSKHKMESVTPLDTFCMLLALSRSYLKIKLLLIDMDSLLNNPSIFSNTRAFLPQISPSNSQLLLGFVSLGEMKESGELM